MRCILKRRINRNLHLESDVVTAKYNRLVLNKPPFAALAHRDTARR
jgi:hypothetical protein